MTPSGPRAARCVVAALGAGVGALVVRSGAPVYPHLGRYRAQWQAAGANARQLAILDEAHRLRAATPPVGYRDRRTTVNPLADAYAIFTSPAWRDPWLADHQLLDRPHRRGRGDPRPPAPGDRAAGARCAAAPPAAGRLRGRPAPTPATSDALLGALDDGLRRSRALTAYRDEVRRLESVLRVSRALPEAEAFGDRVLDVVSQSARHELAAQQLDDSREQLRMVEHGLREITDLLGSAPELPARPRPPGCSGAAP